MNGFLLEALEDIDGVGKDFMMQTAFCGKGNQEVSVSLGGPHVRLRSLKVG